MNLSNGGKIISEQEIHDYLRSMLMRKEHDDVFAKYGLQDYNINGYNRVLMKTNRGLVLYISFFDKIMLINRINTLQIILYNNYFVYLQKIL